MRPYLSAKRAALSGGKRGLCTAVLVTLIAGDIGAQQQGARALHEAGAMGRMRDCMTDGMIAGAALGVVYGMFQTDRTDLRIPAMAIWGVLGFTAGMIPGLGYWAVHEHRRDAALRNERPESVTTPGPRVQSKILRQRPCRGALPFTSGPSEPAAARVLSGRPE